MRKSHVLHTVFDYFYTREKKDLNGNSRFRVYIIDPDGPAVYETILKCYECQIKELVSMFMERVQS